MNFGRSIRIYLADGTPSGIRHVEITNWSGQALLCPRSRFSDLSQWDEVKRPGVYFLLERALNDNEYRVYIGESENVLQRIGDHYQNKDFWNEVVVFTSKDENLTKSHIKYLESRLVAITKSVGRYIIENGNNPTESNLPRADRDSMEEFIEYLKIVMGTLGHKLLENIKVEKISKTQLSESEKMTTSGIDLYFKIRDLTAIGQITDEGFTLLKGSDVSSAIQPSFKGGIKDLKEKWLSDGTLVLNGDNYKLQKDVVLSSSSNAAMLVAGTSRSGPQSWIDNEGRTLKAIEEMIAEKMGT
ncbi:MAG: GIY-YIG nuclease family protein [Bacteroidales bacterium]|nr:GIY-YIG nuclease family protein [Bacteroidales bacterium]